MTESQIRQASLRRLRQFGVRPNRDLGQNFLIDDNLLGVIARAAELGSSDVVLEVGGGLGVLSEFLASHTRFVHVFEVDRALEPALVDAIGELGNVELHFEDAVRADLGALEPQPRKFVANLPYSIATPVILRTVVERPEIEVWCAMVQREIADRLCAEPGSKIYGAPSVIAQLACSVKFLRPVSRTVFVPQPRVDSALVLLKRSRPFPGEELRAFVGAAFAHRRKALARSVAIAAADDPGLAGVLGLGGLEPRAAVREALAQLDKPADCRAERLAPAEFEQLLVSLGDSGGSQ